MALKSETASPPDGMVNVINRESGGDGDDLEDGEIFDDEDDTSVSTQPAAPTATSNSPVPPPPPIISSLPDEKKKLSPVRKTMAERGRQRRGKRPREDERPFKSTKQRRRSDDSDKDREKNIGDDDNFFMEEDLHGQDWDRGHHRPNQFLLDIDEDLDDDEEDLLRRGRGFGNRNRRGRNGRGVVPGRRGMGRRENGGQICKFYLQGKCQRGAECPFSHSQRKYEVCKFYMNDCCAKKDRCLFLHSEFPCKYHYLGMKCYAGKKCKFSHTKIPSQLRANLLRDSKEHIDSPPPEKEGRSRRERDRDRDRDRDHRDRDHRERDREKERAKERERERAKRDEKFTLHFKVDPRTISEEEEGNRTPMPSPSPDSTSDRGSRSPEVNKRHSLSPKADISKSESRDNGVSDELPDFIPPDLPKHQRELYKRIHLQQREVSSIKTEENEVEKETEDYREENWYSSEEEEDGKKMEPIAAIINKLKQPPAVQRPPSPPKQTAPPGDIPVSSILTNIDVNAVFKLLSTVQQTIKLKEAQSKEGQSDVPVPPITTTPLLGAVPPSGGNTTTVTASAPSATAQLVTTTISPSINPLPTLSSLIPEPAPPAEKRRMRDPRLRGNSTEDDVDLRMGPRADVDLRQLPFKPAPIHPPASEIDASVTSHPPVAYRLVPISPPPPPDYSNVHSKNINDPRLKKHIPGELTNLQPMIPSVPSIGLLRPPLEGPRDPRQRIMVPNDPRRKSSLLLQRDSDLRQPPQLNIVNDVDLRMHPPTPHLAFK